jgi:hypothetical protein
MRAAVACILAVVVVLVTLEVIAWRECLQSHSAFFCARVLL